MKKLELVGGETSSGNASDRSVAARLFDSAALGGRYEAPKK